MTLKEKIKEYSETLTKEQTLSYAKRDFEAGAKFVIEEIYKALTPEEIATPIVLLTAVYDCLEELERE